MRLTDLRKSQGLTQQQLAERAGITRTQIAKLETGTQTIGRTEFATVVKIADALSVNNPRDLLD